MALLGNAGQGCGSGVVVQLRAGRGVEAVDGLGEGSVVVCDVDVVDVVVVVCDVVDVVDVVVGMDSMEGAAEKVSLAVVVEEDTVVEDEDIIASRAQVFPPMQAYPNGQHERPHRGSRSSSLEVLTGFFGNRAGSWRATSQVIGLIYEQFWPLGQQMAELASSRLMHVADEGQQKLDGRLGLLHPS